jgi:branched-chain amino acid transport system substrate-binding protein
MAKGAGANVKGIFGSTNWHWSLQDEGLAKPSCEILRHQVRLPAVQAAHTCYVQALLYADAVERAGSFNPCAVGRSAQGLRVRRHGQRPDALSRRRPPVLQGRAGREGKENPTSEFDLLEIVEVTPVEQVTYDARSPAVRGRRTRHLQPGA